MQYEPKLGILENVKRLYRERNTVSARCDNNESALLLACHESTVGDTWDAEERYTKDRYVLDEGHIFRCLIPNHGVKPSTDSEQHYWLHTNVVKELNYLNDKISKQ